MTERENEILTVRDGDRPEPLLTIRVDGDRARLDDLRHVILIHGFANSEPDATKSYSIFRGMLNGVTNTDVPKLQIRVWDFHWPGDRPSDNHLFGRIGSAATYAARIGTAGQSGEALARLLLQLEPDQEVVLVAHSLGCRVALRCLKWLAEWAPPGPHVRVSAACLMAPAVPENACATGEPYGRALPKCKEIVLYSDCDKVLRRAFPIGQALFGESGHAVGVTGNPHTRWHQEVNGGGNTHLGHGDYWSNKQTAELVGRLLGLYHQVTLPEVRRCRSLLGKVLLPWRPI